MKFSAQFAIPAALVLASAVQAQTNTLAWELADPSSKVLIGIDVRSIRNSEFGKAFSSQMQGQSSALANAPFKIPGIELLDDVDSVFISSTAEPAAKAAAAKPGKPAAKTTDDNPPFLLVVKGNFPMEHLQPLLSGKHPSYKAYNIYGSNGANLAVMDDHTLVFGDTKSIRSAIDRKAARPSSLSPIFTRAQELAAANDFWMIAKDASLNSKQAAANPFASEIEGVELAMQVREGFGLDLNLGTKTEATAAMFAQLVSMQIQSAVAGKANDPALAELTKKFQVGAQGNRFTMRIALTKDEMERSVKAVQTARANAGAQTASVAATPRPAAATAAPAQPAPPPGPRKVRIYGLDEGVREITIDPKP
jgi:hypothetical protein